MNTEIKNMWRKKSWSIPDLLGSKSEYTKIVIGLINEQVYIICLRWDWFYGIINFNVALVQERRKINCGLRLK